MSAPGKWPADRRIGKADCGQSCHLHRQVIAVVRGDGLQPDREAVEQAGRDGHRRMAGQVEGPAEVPGRQVRLVVFQRETRSAGSSA
jgi:hypothetical protein